MSDTPSTIEIWDALDDNEKKLHAHLLEIELGEAKQLIHETASGLVQERENMLAEVLSAQAERDQWRTMAQELADALKSHVQNYMMSPVSSGADSALSRFNELNTPE